MSEQTTPIHGLCAYCDLPAGHMGDHRWTTTRTIEVPMPVVSPDAPSGETTSWTNPNPAPSRTMKLRLDVEHYNATNGQDARYIDDETGREIRFVSSSAPSGDAPITGSEIQQSAPSGEGMPCSVCHGECLTDGRDLCAHCGASGVEPSGEGMPDIHVLLRQYVDAATSAGMAEANAGDYAETDPDVDRAWETVARLRTEIGLYIVGLEDANARLTRERDEAVAAEREACARFVEEDELPIDIRRTPPWQTKREYGRVICEEIAARLRSRSSVPPTPGADNGQ